jgi:plastocyanin domain-containing protein
MSGTEWMVMLGAAAAIALVNWYFFVAGRSRTVSAVEGSQLTVTVDGGYDPQTVRVKAGAPVKIVFDRRDDSSCSEEVVFPDFGIRRYLPSGKQTTIELTPPKPGTYDFMCGMSMLRGKLIAE